MRGWDHTAVGWFDELALKLGGNVIVRVILTATHIVAVPVARFAAIWRMTDPIALVFFPAAFTAIESTSTVRIAFGAQIPLEESLPALAAGSGSQRAQEGGQT